MSDLISRQAAIDAIETITWYHQSKNKNMVSGANSAEHQAWYKAEDVYKAIRELPAHDAESYKLTPDEEWKLAVLKDADVGEIITLDNGLEVMCVYYDHGVNEFITLNCIGRYPMNDKNTTEGGYAASKMRKTLNTEIINLFSAGLVANMLKVFDDDKLRLPLKSEIFGANAWEVMRTCRNRIGLTDSDHLSSYWLQDVHSPTCFARVSGRGAAAYNYAAYVYGVRPVFAIKVDDDVF